MKNLLLSASLLTATGAVAAPEAQTVPPQNPFAVASSPYERLTQASRAQFEAKDFVGAQKTTEQQLALAKTTKEKADALRRLGQTFDAQEQYDKAREFWQQALPLTKDTPGDSSLIDLLVGQSYYKQEKWQLFVDATTPMLGNLSDQDVTANKALRFQLATAYSNLNREDEAREQLKLVVADQKVPAELRGIAQLTLGESYQKAGQWNEARQNFETAAKIEGISGEVLISVYRGLGEVAEKQNRPKEATTAFTQARSLLMQKADGQFKAKDWAGAITSYKAALKTGIPELVVGIVAHMQIGVALEEQHNYTNALAEFQAAIDTPPAESKDAQAQVSSFVKPGAYLGLARIYIAQKQFEPARETLDTLAKIEDLFPLYLGQIEKLRKMLPPKP